MANEYVVLEGKPVQLARPVRVPQRSFVGRESELNLCKMAWGIDLFSNRFVDSDLPPFNFRLEGPPGVGKNEIVYEVARQTGRPLFIIQGHEELTPEDLSLLLVPAARRQAEPSDPDSYEVMEDDRPGDLILQASPLATAIIVGGLCFFDEINRAPERALSPLSSVLDDRVALYSAMTGMFVEPQDDDARRGFRFCCALNPHMTSSGRNLPEYIEQRTLPRIKMEPPEYKDLVAIIERALKPPADLLAAFEEWYSQERNLEISVRQALALVHYAMQHHESSPSGSGDKVSLLQRVRNYILT
ncbi:AAA family ATPase [Amycolatopsis sp. NPDC058278]|uniref:AAA family ATPase n=1 Tax=Amycolatopsis sp. NPDC058278 TaxID=3346417 RepID=UPI0036DDFEE2